MLQSKPEPAPPVSHQCQKVDASLPIGQVQNLAGAGFIHGRSYAVQIAAFNPAAQPGAINFRPFCVWS